MHTNANPAKMCIETVSVTARCHAITVHFEPWPVIVELPVGSTVEADFAVFSAIKFNFELYEPQLVLVQPSGDYDIREIRIDGVVRSTG